MTMTPQEDAHFLALLVHRGYLDRPEAEPLLPELKGGRPLDELLVEKVGWEPAKVEKLRRTSAGEEPEIRGYEIIGRLGLGGTAEVFSAREIKTGKTMALKILNARCTRDANQLKAFVLEARLLERLEHKGLVAGYGVARAGDTYFSRLEMIDGVTLLEHLDEGQTFPEETAFRILLEVAEVLQYMATEDLVHRDVKPGNIMLTQNGEVKLIDLGFCAQTNDQNPTDSAIGTVQYLSPEQAEGGARADLRSDIYALGVTLFQLTIGRLPFEGETDDDTLRAAVMDRLSSPELKSRGHSPHLHYFIEKMMAKEAAERYQSWDELIADMQGQIQGRDSLDYESGAKTRRRRGRR